MPSIFSLSYYSDNIHTHIYIYTYVHTYVERKKAWILHTTMINLTYIRGYECISIVHISSEQRQRGDRLHGLHVQYGTRTIHVRVQKFDADILYRG